jgi:hypothetical protein
VALDAFSPLNLWPPFGPAPGQAGSAAHVEDPWVVLGYNATVAVEYDAAAAGETLSGSYAPKPNWQPVPGLGALRCCLARRSENQAPEMVFSPNSPAMQPRWKFLVGRPVALDLRHRLVLADADRGNRPRYLYVVRPSEDAFFSRKVWVAGLSEHYNPRG